MRQGGRSAARGRSGVLYGLGVSWQGTNVLRQQLKLDQDRRSFGPRARRSGCYGAFRDGEEPLRGSQMARRLLEGAGVQVVGRVQRPRDRGPDDFKDYGMPSWTCSASLTGTPCG